MTSSKAFKSHFEMPTEPFSSALNRFPYPRNRPTFGDESRSFIKSVIEPAIDLRFSTKNHPKLVAEPPVGLGGAKPYLESSEPHLENLSGQILFS
jgi:hypothetical protein